LIQHLLNSLLLLPTKLGLLLPDGKLLGDARTELIRSAVIRCLRATSLNVLQLRTKTPLTLCPLDAFPIPAKRTRLGSPSLLFLT
jgi:hypothetical protein